MLRKSSRPHVESRRLTESRLSQADQESLTDDDDTSPAPRKDADETKMLRKSSRSLVESRRLIESKSQFNKDDSKDSEENQDVSPSPPNDSDETIIMKKPSPFYVERKSSVVDDDQMQGDDSSPDPPKDLDDKLPPKGSDDKVHQKDSDDKVPTSTSGKAEKVKRKTLKPPYSYVGLVSMAILTSPDRQATASEIYEKLEMWFDFFRGPTGWRDSVRHNLSAATCFKMTGSGKRHCNPWTVDVADVKDIHLQRQSKNESYSSFVHEHLGYPNVWELDKMDEEERQKAVKIAPTLARKANPVKEPCSNKKEITNDSGNSTKITQKKEKQKRTNLKKSTEISDEKEKKKNSRSKSPTKLPNNKKVKKNTKPIKDPNGSTESDSDMKKESKTIDSDSSNDLFGFSSTKYEDVSDSMAALFSVIDTFEPLDDTFGPPVWPTPDSEQVVSENEQYEYTGWRSQDPSEATETLTETLPLTTKEPVKITQRQQRQQAKQVAELTEVCTSLNIEDNVEQISFEHGEDNTNNSVQERECEASSSTDDINPPLACSEKNKNTSDEITSDQAIKELPITFTENDPAVESEHLEDESDSPMQQEVMEDAKEMVMEKGSTFKENTETETNTHNVTSPEVTSPRKEKTNTVTDEPESPIVEGKGIETVNEKEMEGGRSVQENPETESNRQTVTSLEMTSPKKENEEKSSMGDEFGSPIVEGEVIETAKEMETEEVSVQFIKCEESTSTEEINTPLACFEENKNTSDEVTSDQAIEELASAFTENDPAVESEHLEDDSYSPMQLMEAAKEMKMEKDSTLQTISEPETNTQNMTSPEITSPKKGDEKKRSMGDEFGSPIVEGEVIETAKEEKGEKETSLQRTFDADKVSPNIIRLEVSAPKNEEQEESIDLPDIAKDSIGDLTDIPKDSTVLLNEVSTVWEETPQLDMHPNLDDISLQEVVCEEIVSAEDMMHQVTVCTDVNGASLNDITYDQTIEELADAFTEDGPALGSENPEEVFGTPILEDEGVKVPHVNEVEDANNPQGITETVMPKVSTDLLNENLTIQEEPAKLDEHDMDRNDLIKESSIEVVQEHPTAIASEDLTDKLDTSTLKYDAKETDKVREVEIDRQTDGIDSNELTNHSSKDIFQELYPAFASENTDDLDTLTLKDEVTETAKKEDVLQTFDTNRVSQNSIPLDVSLTKNEEQEQCIDLPYISKDSIGDLPDIAKDPTGLLIEASPVVEEIPQLVDDGIAPNDFYKRSETFDTPLGDNIALDEEFTKLDEKQGKELQVCPENNSDDSGTSMKERESKRSAPKSRKGRKESSTKGVRGLANTRTRRKSKLTIETEKLDLSTILKIQENETGQCSEHHDDDNQSMPKLPQNETNQPNEVTSGGDVSITSVRKGRKRKLEKQEVGLTNVIKVEERTELDEKEPPVFTEDNVDNCVSAVDVNIPEHAEPKRRVREGKKQDSAEEDKTLPNVRALRNRTPVKEEPVHNTADLRRTEDNGEKEYLSGRRKKQQQPRKISVDHTPDNVRTLRNCTLDLTQEGSGKKYTLERRLSESKLSCCSFCPESHPVIKNEKEQEEKLLLHQENRNRISNVVANLISPELSQNGPTELESHEGTTKRKIYEVPKSVKEQGMNKRKSQEDPDYSPVPCKGLKRGRPRKIQESPISQDFTVVSGLTLPSDPKRRKRIDCYDGPLTFKTQIEAKQSLDTNSRTKPFTSPVCGKSFSHRHNLVAHIFRLHTQERPYACTECSRVFAYHFDLSDHVQEVHIKRGIFSCAQCNQRFANKKRLQDHMASCKTRKSASSNTHVQEEGVTCSKCQKHFKDEISLRTHMAYHQGTNFKKHVLQKFKGKEVDIACTKCKKSFKDKSTFRAHMALHQRKKPVLQKVKVKKVVISCPKCKKNFKDKTTLRAHMAYHHRKKPVLQKVKVKKERIACTKCKKHFKDKITLRAHMAFHQAKNRALKKANVKNEVAVCKKCKKEFKSKNSLNAHTLIYHQGKKRTSKQATQVQKRVLTCSKCPKRFKDKITLRAHMAYHQAKNRVTKKEEGKEEGVVCPQCSKRYKNKNALRQHRFRVHRDKKIVSTLVEDKSVTCAVCAKRFKNKDSLRAHRNKKHKVTGVIGKKIQKKKRDVACVKGQRHFKDNFTLRVRMSGHQPKKSSPKNAKVEQKEFSCANCDKRFKTKNGLKSHRFRFHREKKIIVKKVKVEDTIAVDEAPKDTEGSDTTRVPIVTKQPKKSTTKKVQLSEDDFPCSKCPKHFKKKDSLRIHVMRNHQEKKDVSKKPDVKKKVFSCARCQKHFKDRNTLRAHMAYLTGCQNASNQ